MIKSVDILGEILKRDFLNQYLNNISNFPSWLKEIIYSKLSEEISMDDNLAYIFVSYKPVLTYKGRCEHDFKKSGFDSNIYNILDGADKDFSISEITLNTYLSLEEVARYFLFCTDEGFFEIPDNSEILNLAGFLAGKYRTGEYFANTGKISDEQLETTVNTYKNNPENKKFGQTLVEKGLITPSQLKTILKIKEDAQKRFVLDFNDVPKIKKETTSSEISQKEIEKLQQENKLLKTKLEQLLTMVTKND